MIRSLSERMLCEVRRVSGNRTVLLGLSGGADSVVLLHLLKKACLPVICVHVEHGIRGGRSLADRDFVEALCKRENVPLVVCPVDVPCYAKAQGKSIEEAARLLRYAAFERVRKERLCDAVMTAHHADDQAETILLHILRGTSVQGLSGMRQEENGILRPLLPFSKQEILAYASENGLSFVTDETNADTTYTRNFVRHRLLPEMEKVNPAVSEALCRLGKTAAQQSDYITQEAKKVLADRANGTHLNDISDLHVGLSSVVLMEYLRNLGFVKDVSQTDVERLLALFGMHSGGRATIGKALFERDRIGISLVSESSFDGEVPLHEGLNDTPFGRIEISAAEAGEPIDQGKNVQLLDADRIGSLSVRARREKDRVKPLGNGGSKLLSDLFTDKKVPRHRRDSVPLIISGGEIVWVGGIAATENAKITDATKRMIKITLRG